MQILCIFSRTHFIVKETEKTPVVIDIHSTSTTDFILHFKPKQGRKLGGIMIWR